MIEDGGSAYPGIQGEHGYGNATSHQTMSGQSWINHNQGMSLRDWFAGQALQGILAAPSPLADQAWKSDAVVAEWSYSLADAMIQARKKKS